MTGTGGEVQAVARAPGSVREATRRWGRGTVFGGERPRSRSKGERSGGSWGGECGVRLGFQGGRGVSRPWAWAGLAGSWPSWAKGSNGGGFSSFLSFFVAFSFLF